MKNKINIIIVVLLTLSFIQLVSGQSKLAQTSMKFLLVSTDSRVAAMGDAVTGLEGNSSAMFSNPAGLARLSNVWDATVGSVNWIADIKYYSGGIAFAPFEGKYGVVGVSGVYVDYGDFLGTTRAKNDGGYLDVGIFKPKAYCAGVTYAMALSDKFSVGGSIRYASQDLLGGSVLSFDFTGDSFKSRKYRPSAVIYDFGMLYHTGLQSLDFGVSVRNFSKEIKLELEGYQLPLMFQIGIAYNLSDVLKLDKNEHSIQIAVDANHPRDFAEQLMMGIEYKFKNMVALRCGYSTPNDEHGFTGGFGLQQNIGGVDLGIDYAYTPWTTFSTVHKFSLHFGM